MNRPRDISSILADMNKRQFLKTTGVFTIGALLAPSLGCATLAPSVQPSASQPGFSLPPLGYAFNALEPHIDALTMEIHHGKHHQAYITNLNKALESTPELQSLSLEALCATIKPEQAALRNNAGGHYNHSKFWKWISPGGPSSPEGPLLDAINNAFGSLDEFKNKLSEAAKTRFGSGWAWLNVGADKKLFINSTPNQDNPLMNLITDKPGIPILGIDVWEHAYYLKYQNKRPDYITAFFNVVNWNVVAEDYLKAIG